jgi:hypothetical protein
MTDRASRALPRPATLAAWCPTCLLTQACALSPETPDSDSYRCVVCGHPASNPVLRFARLSRDRADSAA